MVRHLESWGLRVLVGEHVLDRRGYLAGSDEDRLADLNAAIGNPQVRAVIATTGGCGSLRLVNGVDVEALSNDPKPLLGYSDVTALHQVWRATGVPSLHGAITGTQRDNVRQLLFDDASTVVTTETSALSAQLTSNGHADGVLFGGNLEMLARAVGIMHLDLTGVILLLEINRAAGLGMVDRALTQLRFSGALDTVTGIAVGSIDQFTGYTDRDWTILDVLHDHLDRLAVPVLGGLPLGHLDDPVTVPLGVHSRLDTTTGTLTVQSLSAR